MAAIVENGLMAEGVSLPLDRVRALVRLLQKDDAVGALIRSCNEAGEAFLFGGLVRDAMFGSSAAFGDVDIFVSGPLDLQFAERLSRVARRTNFGGIRLVVGRFDVDIWELPKSYAFRVERGRTISIRSLLSTVCYSTDAVAVSLVNARVIASTQFKRTVSDRVFSFISKPLGLEILQAVRMARIVVKNDVMPDREVAGYFLRALSEFGCEKILSAEAKWKGRRVLDDFLLSRVSEVCNGIIHGDLRRSLEFNVPFDLSSHQSHQNPGRSALS